MSVRGWFSGKLGPHVRVCVCVRLIFTGDIYIKQETRMYACVSVGGWLCAAAFPAFAQYCVSG